MSNNTKFRQLYNALPATGKSPREEWIEDIARISCSSTTTVRMWLYGTQVPSPIKTEAIAKHLGVDASKLFEPVEQDNN